MSYHRVKLPETMMTDAPVKKRYSAIRWPSLDRAILSGDPDQAPKPGDTITITGEDYVVEEVYKPMTFEIKVQQRKL